MNIQERVSQFVELVQSLQKPVGDVNYRKVYATFGKKYAKVICDTYVHCFIDLANGNILKPAGWSRPAPHARGNIFSEDLGRTGITMYRAAYLR